MSAETGHHGPDSHGEAHGGASEMLKTKVDQLKQSVEHGVEDKSELIREYADKIKALVEEMRQVLDIDGEAAREAVKEAFHSLVGLLEKYGFESHGPDQEEFERGLARLEQELHLKSREEFQKMLNGEDPEAMNDFTKRLETIEISPAQNRRLEQLQIMNDLLVAMSTEFQRGGKTWTMWAARFLISSEQETATAESIKKSAKELINNGVLKIMQDPNANLESVVPADLLTLFQAPPSMAGVMWMSPVNFHEAETEAELNQIRTEAMQALRDLKHYGEADAIGTQALKPYLDKAKEKVPPQERNQVAIYLELLKSPKAQDFLNEAKAKGLSHEEAVLYVQDISYAMADAEAFSNAGKYLDPSELPAHLRPVWEQYNDLHGYQGSMNFSDETKAFIIEELLVNGALLAAGLLTGISAGAGAVNLSVATLNFMRAGRLAKYIGTAASGVSALAMAEGAVAVGLAERAALLGVQLTAESVAEVAFIQGANFFGSEQNFAEFLHHSPHWVQEFMYEMAVKGTLRRVGYFEGALKGVLSPDKIEQLTSRIGNHAVRELSKEMITKGNVEGGVKVMLKASQEGMYEPDAEFNEIFGDVLYQIYKETYAGDTIAKTMEFEETVIEGRPA